MGKEYSRLSLSRSRRDPLKNFGISVLRHIRFAELTKIPIEQPNFTNEHVIWLFEIYVEILWKRGGIASEEQFLLLSTIFCYLMLDFYVKTRIRFSLRDKRLLEITEVEITRVECICFSKEVSSVTNIKTMFKIYPTAKETRKLITFQLIEN